MPSYLQIEGDPTQWLLNQPIDSSTLTNQPVSVQVQAPLAGTLLFSPRSAVSVAIVYSADGGGAPSDLAVLAPTIYLPTATGPSGGSVGYELSASVDVAALASGITAAMTDGSYQVIALADGAQSGVLLLNGAALSFVVLCPGSLNAPSGGGPVPSD